LQQCLATFPGAGMAGALLLAPDGRIAAAGAILAPDGGLLPRGHGERPDHPDFASISPVEALPLGAAMLPVEIWRRFGGLDETIADPTLALADLALRLRDAGLLVLCQPFARLTAAPAATPDPWTDAYGRFRLRRRRDAGGHGLAALGLSRPDRPRALFVDNFVPTPDRDAASLDMQAYLRSFVALGYDTTLLPVGDLSRADGYVDDLRRQGVRVIANGFAASAPEFLARAPAPFDVILLYRASLAAGALPDVLKAHSPQARLVFNTTDLHFVRLEREAQLLRSPDQLEEAFRVQQVELATIARADCTILLSPAEQRLIADLLPRARTCVVPIARDVRGRAAPFAPRHGVLFVGGFRHRPNLDAVLAFARETWPLIRRRLPTTLGIVGADPPDEVRALADPDAGVAVLGHVENLDALMDECRLTIAPLRFGAGTKGKIVTSLAAGVPCVASPVAVEGMGLTDRLHVRVGRTPETFADAVIEVHEQEDVWTALSDAGLEFALENFSVAGARARLCAMLRDLGLPIGA
jgi:glycosyltransferase involved in cell wall biosynthesis